MKVTGTGGLSQTPGAKPARGAASGESFRIAGSPTAAAPAQVSGAAGVSSVMGVEAMLALQDVESPTERKRRSVKRAGRLLDELDAIKIAMLGGDLGRGQLDALARAVREQRAATEDPKLEAVLDEIETRAAVELAKFQAAGGAA
jgi:hypothetical protein